jgi:hypothetical protein
MTENLAHVAEAGAHEPLVDPQTMKSCAGSPPVFEQPMEGCSTFLPFGEKPYTEKLKTQNLKLETRNSKLFKAAGEREGNKQTVEN